MTEYPQIPEINSVLSKHIIAEQHDTDSMDNIAQHCSENDYQCTDTGACIPNAWLCDGYPDCANGGVELISVCSEEITYAVEITHCGQTPSGALSRGDVTYFSFNPASINDGRSDFDVHQPGMQ